MLTDMKENVSSILFIDCDARLKRSLNDAVFGQVVSINQGFGFIQPYREKEQAYYNQRGGM